MYEHPISNNKENNNFATPLGCPWQKYIFKNIYIYIFECLISNKNAIKNVAPSHGPIPNNK